MNPKSQRRFRDIAISIATLPLGLAIGWALVVWMEQPSTEGKKADSTQVGDTVNEPEVSETVQSTSEPEEGQASEVGDDSDMSVDAVAASISDDGDSPLEDVAPELAAEGTQEVVVTDEVPDEATGGKGEVEDRVPDAEQVPVEEIDICDEIFKKTMKESISLKTREGATKAGFTVEFDGITSEWSLMTASTLPGDLFTVNVIENLDTERFQFEADKGKLIESDGDSATWKAPQKPGICCLKIKQVDSENMMCIHLAVMQPWDGDSEYVNGYRIGKYQDEPFRGNPRYKKPRGFIEVTEENVDSWLSPHLQLSQFVCKQEADFPKYMLVDTRLLLKLENLIEELEASGRDASNLYISSGYRTPAYNYAIGNKTSYSRHLYGDAADLFVDANRDGKIDDLDFSGSVDDADAEFIQRAVEEVSAGTRYLMGGLGFYSVKNYRNPFIHVDTRGYPARWNK